MFRYFSLISLVIYSSFWPFSKSLGFFGFLLLSLVSFVGVIKKQRLYVDLVLLSLTLISSFYLFISFMNVLPSGWTLEYDPNVIIRQGYYVIALFIYITIYSNIWIHIFKNKYFDRFLLMSLVLCSVISPIIFYLNSEGFRKSESYFKLNALYNSEMILVFIIGFFLLYRRVFGPKLFIIVWLVVVVNTTHVQTLLVVLVLPIYYFNLASVKFTWLMVIGICLSVVVFMPLAKEVSYYDINIAIRLLFWYDALYALVQTYGVGVGFGTEAIKNSYDLFVYKELVPSDDPNLLYIGVHNTFVSYFFRLGVVGGVIFMIWFYSLNPTISKAKVSNRFKRECEFSLWLYFVAFINIFSNVSIESLNFFIGTIFVLSYLLAEKITKNNTWHIKSISL